MVILEAFPNIIIKIPAIVIIELVKFMQSMILFAFIYFQA